MFRCGMIPVIIKPTRVTTHTATAIDCMFTNSLINTEIKSAIIKADISDHFPILFVAKVKVDVNIKTEQYILKRNITDQPIKKFKQKLRGVTWDDIKIFDSVNNSYDRFLQIFLSLYNECFPKIKIKLKPQKHFRPWITLGIRKSSKRKQKHIKTCLKQLNVNLKEYYYSQKILEYKNNAKKTSNIMKEVIGKTNKPGSRLPTKLVINKNDVTSEISIANQFNKFFTKISPELAEKIPTASRVFESFLNKIDTTMPADPVTVNELKEAFFPLKTNKAQVMTR